MSEQRPEAGVPEANALAVQHQRRRGRDAEHAAAGATGEAVRLAMSAPAAPPSTDTT